MPLGDPPCELFAAILLQEMPGVRQDGVGLALCARDQLLQPPLGAPHDRIAAAEKGEKGLAPLLQRLPRGAVGSTGRIVGASGNQQGKLAV